MKLKYILMGMLLLAGYNAMAQPTEANYWSTMQNLKAKAWIHRTDFKQKNTTGRFTSVSPSFLIYPDKPCSEEEATRLIQEWGIDEYVKNYSGSVCIMNPCGKKYDNTTDFQVYKDYINATWCQTNLKVIGIGKGATFVAKAIANHAGAIADILLINPASVTTSRSMVAPVPVYVYGKNAGKMAKPFIQRNRSTQQAGKELKVYTNTTEPLLRVVVDHRNITNKKDLFQSVWNNLFSKNYRLDNHNHTWYKGAKFEQYGVANELEPYMMLDQLEVKRNVVEKDLLGTGTFLWYEYFPKGTEKAPRASVPLVVLLHGNNNDPRTQAETSGFIELAANEKFAVAELEWQGNGYTPMGLDGIEQVVYYLLKQYPQLDASRVYAEGLSAGCFTATTLGVRKSYLFAAVGGHSGGVFLPGRYAFGVDQASLMNEARQKRGHLMMPYFNVAGNKDEEVPYPNPSNYEKTALFNAIQVYQTLNNMDVIDKMDFNIDPVFGLKLQHRTSLKTNKNVTIESGYLYQNNIPLIKLNTVMDYGHWNFKPDAKLMWDFFKQFSRNPETKELIYHGQ